MNRNSLTKSRASQKGIAVMTTGMMLLFTVPFAGLAIDCAALYMVKARLQGATDAAALAAARSLNLGMTLAAQQSSADTGAHSYFNYNFPVGYMGSSSPTITTAFTQVNTVVQVTVTGQVTTPLYFMRILGGSTQIVAAVGQATRRNVNLIMVLDKSGSMLGSPCTQMKTAASQFTTGFANQRDRLGLISFNGSYNLDFAPNQTFLPGMQTAINNISCTGNTGTAQALYQGWQQLIQINEPLSLNVIVFFSDGQPNGVVADYPIKTKQDVRYGDNQTVSQNGSNVGTCGMGSTCTIAPSYCKDAAGNTWYKDLSNNNYTAGSPNPAWSPGTARGFMAEWNGGPAQTGTTAGLTTWAGSENPVSFNGNKCAWNSSQTAHRRDIAFIPSQDIYGSKTYGYKTNFNQPSNAYNGNDFFPAGNPYYDSTQHTMRPDSPSAITNASFNAADDVATKILNDATYTPAIYAIGLGGNPGYPPDTEFMCRLTNAGVTNWCTAGMDSRFDSTKYQGVYQFSPNANQLQQAFALIQSQVLRISH